MRSFFETLKIWNQYNNPYYYWWKVRKHFVRPKWKLVYHGKEPTWFYGMYINSEYYNRFFDFQIKGLGWKSKWGEYRHEWDPMIILTIFRKYQCVWMLTYVNDQDPDSHTRNVATWEAILDMTSGKHPPLSKIIENHTWIRYKNNEDELSDDSKIYITIDKNIRSYE